MNYNYTIKIDLEEKEKEAIRTLAQAYEQCVIDDRIECDDCPFYDDNLPCIPFFCNEFKEKMK